MAALCAAAIFAGGGLAGAAPIRRDGRARRAVLAAVRHRRGVARSRRPPDPAGLRPAAAAEADADQDRSHHRFAERGAPAGALAAAGDGRYSCCSRRWCSSPSASASGGWVRRESGGRSAVGSERAGHRRLAAAGMGGRRRHRDPLRRCDRALRRHAAVSSDRLVRDVDLRRRRPGDVCPGASSSGGSGRRGGDRPGNSILDSLPRRESGPTPSARRASP